MSARASGSYQLGISARFALALATGMLLLAGIGWAAVSAAGSARTSMTRIYSDSVVATRAISDLAARLDDAEAAVLYGLVTTDAGERRLVVNQLASSILPAVAVDIADVTRRVADSPQQTRVARRLAADWTAFTSRLATLRVNGGTLASRSVNAAALKSVLDRATEAAHSLFRAEGVDATQVYGRALAASHSDVRRTVELIVLGLVVVVLLLVWLMRALLPRMLAFSRFAQRMADGDYGGRLDSSGSDEIALLGRTLDAVAQRHREDEVYDATQAEFSDALQVADDERAVQDLLRVHLERSISAASVTVLNRNNSADASRRSRRSRQARRCTPGSRHATPRSCLAVRSATVHAQPRGREPLVACAVCSGCDGSTVCTPLLVCGEVIGAVLVDHHEALKNDEKRRLRESVRQAAPVIANLRNLAIARLRASTDSLTGLPNRRALDDTVKRMVAQASRSSLSLAALMLDLDHFKRINDELGHAKGDEILAAVGAQLQDLLRASDFGARYGGEEFVVLLPATDIGGALTFAERLRLAFHDLHLPHVDRSITTSIGVAVLPDHAQDASTLIRAADRALYLAKTNGRDRIELATVDAVAATHRDVAAR